MISIGISTRDRFESLLRCVLSLEKVDTLLTEIIIFDDGSATPVEQGLAERVPRKLFSRIRVLRTESNLGYIVGRNRIAAASTTQFLLSLDDDACLLESKSVESALHLLNADESLLAVAFSQAEANGQPWPIQYQPAPVSYCCFVASFIGFAAMLRKSLFLSLGGYRESLFFYAEEKELCIRALDAGHAVAYLPWAKIAHLPDPSGRNIEKFMRYRVRNDCLTALHNFPTPLNIAAIGLQLMRLLRSTLIDGTQKRTALKWIISELKAQYLLMGNRHPIRWSTIRRWNRTRKERPHYEVPELTVGEAGRKQETCQS